jgi:cell division protein FtsI (penicillin-binding protein 3)
LHSTSAQEGTSVTLTLDHTIQAQAEAVLRNTIDHWHAKGASAIVLDPRTGAILAMAVEKGYDANRFPIVPKDRQRNRTVTDTYEPGSTFKLVTVSAVLSEGLVTPSTAFRLPYSIHVADRIIRDAHPRDTERMTVDQIVSQSSNVGTITLAEKLGADKLSQWVSRFGFGHLTGIDFPGETPGIVPPLDKWSGSTIGTLPIGHGIAITPVQMAAAYGTVANDGVWLQPHLVDRVGSEARRHVTSRRILTPRVSRQVLRMMEDVVIEGTGQEAKVPGYKVAGKTGTAAKPDPQGGYSTTKYVASFVGIVPATSPRLVILVTVDEPAASIWGGVVAAPAFQQIAGFDLQYLEIPPDDPSSLPAQQ